MIIIANNCHKKRIKQTVLLYPFTKYGVSIETTQRFRLM
jgi:hypothetical protein